MLFVPDVHKLAVEISSTKSISLPLIKKYLQGAFQKIGYNFSIFEETKKATIDQIKNSYQLIRLEAKLSYKNGGDNTDSFTGVFEQQINSSGEDEIELLIKSHNNQSINKGENSLADAVLNIATHHGNAKATVLLYADSKKRITINTEDYREELILKERDSTRYKTDLYNQLKNRYKGRTQ